MPLVGLLCAAYRIMEAVSECREQYCTESGYQQSTFEMDDAPGNGIPGSRRWFELAYGGWPDFAREWKSSSNQCWFATSQGGDLAWRRYLEEHEQSQKPACPCFLIPTCCIQPVAVICE